MIVGCDKTEVFTCKVVDSEVKNITDSSATLVAEVVASDYNSIERMGFMISDDFYFVEEIGRYIECDITGLQQNRNYTFSVVIYANGDSWIIKGDTFTTLPKNSNPTPEPEPGVISR